MSATKLLRQMVDDLDDNIARLEMAVDNGDAAMFRNTLSHTKTNYKAAVEVHQVVGRELKEERRMLRNLVRETK